MAILTVEHGYLIATLNYYKPSKLLIIESCGSSDSKYDFIYSHQFHGCPFLRLLCPRIQVYKTIENVFIEWTID